MKKLPVLIFLAAGMLIFAASCSVDNSNNTSPQQGNFLMTNVSPDAPPLNVFINNSQFLQGLGYGSYTPYYNLTAGSYTFSFFDSASASTPVLSNTVSVSPSTNYSYFVIDSFSKVKSSFVQDNLVQPNIDSVYIRFFNFSPNAGAVSLHESTLDTTLSSSRSFNDQEAIPGLANFIRLKSGSMYIYNFQIKGSDSTLLASRTDTLSGGHIYTLFAKGNIGGTGTQVISIGQIQNY